MKVKINDSIFKVKLAISNEEKERGMMNSKFNKSFNGMLFIMEKQYLCFWMKNCIIPLDIIILDKNVITKIHHNSPPCETEDCPSYCGTGNMVLEVLGGTCQRDNIKVGDYLDVT